VQNKKKAGTMIFAYHVPAFFIIA